MLIRVFPLLFLALSVFAQGTAPSVKIENIKDKTSITYKIVHPLHEFESTSKEVTARVELDRVSKEIKSVAMSVDVTTFDSGNSNRDSHAMEVVDALTYPDASFTSTMITRKDDLLQVAGKLTFHGVTKDVTLSAKPSWSADTLKVQGALTTTLTSFNIERPSLLLVPVKDSLWFNFSAMFLAK